MPGDAHDERPSRLSPMQVGLACMLGSAHYTLRSPRMGQRTMPRDSSQLNMPGDARPDASVASELQSVLTEVL